MPLQIIIMYTLPLLLAIWIIIYFFMVFNGIISLHNQVDKAWYNIDELLKQRYDEIPNLVQVCKAYMSYEQEVLQKISEARALYEKAGTVNRKITLDASVSEGLSGIFAAAEKYPDLKANRTYQYVFRRLRELEEKIADRRAFYNEYVQNYNNRVERFPDGAIASLFGYKKAAYFQLRGRSRLVNEVSFNEERI